MKAVAKITSYMEDCEDRDPWIIKGNTYNLIRTNHPRPNLYQFIDEEGHDHYIGIGDFDDFFREED